MDGRTEREEFAQLTTSLTSMLTNLCRVVLASFSAMQQVVEPELLAGVLREMSAEAGPVFGDDRVRQHVQELIANDGTLLPALPRMAWARWQNPQNRAGKLHLEFSVWRQVPVEFTVTTRG